MNIKKIPPQSTDAEQAILGGLMLDDEAWHSIEDVIREEDFYSPAHRKIFSAIRNLKLKNQPSDLITVTNILMESNELEVIGGPSYLAEIMNQIVCTANIESYARIVQDKALLRRLIQMSQGFMDKAFSNDFEDMNSFLDEVETSVFAIAQKKSVKDLSSSSDLVKMSLEKLEELYAQKGLITGTPSGYVEMDSMTAGFQPSEMTIMAARPSMGKTALSLNIALNAAVVEKKCVAYFSVEMAKEQLMIRLLANDANIPLSEMRNGDIADDGWPRLIASAAKISESRLFIDDTSGISPFEIRAKCRRLKARHGLDIIFIDYLQLMTLQQRVENREREISEISKMLKAIAKELEVPVIALAQLNRSVEGRVDKRPMLSDLRESGSIEQDADIIMMIYREDYYDRDNPDIRGIAEIIINKQRNGPTGTVKLRWQPEFGQFLNHTEDQMGPSNPYNQQSAPKTFQGGSFPSQMKGPPKNFAPK